MDIGAARRLLDEDHYALDKLKRRLLEYLAVRQLKTSLKVPPRSLSLQQNLLLGRLRTRESTS